MIAWASNPRRRSHRHVTIARGRSLERASVVSSDPGAETGWVKQGRIHFQDPAMESASLKTTGVIVSYPGPRAPGRGSAPVNPHWVKRFFHPPLSLEKVIGPWSACPCSASHSGGSSPIPLREPLLHDHWARCSLTSAWDRPRKTPVRGPAPARTLPGRSIPIPATAESVARQ